MRVHNDLANSIYKGCELCQQGCLFIDKYKLARFLYLTHNKLLFYDTSCLLFGKVFRTLQLNFSKYILLFCIHIERYLHIFKEFPSHIDTDDWLYTVCGLRNKYVYFYYENINPFEFSGSYLIPLLNNLCLCSFLFI